MTSAAGPVFTPCPNCGGERWADVAAQHKTHWDAAEGLVWGSTTHSILECRGCKTVYVEVATVFSEDDEPVWDHESESYINQPRRKRTYWPAPAKRARPAWAIPSPFSPAIDHLYDEVYAALDTDLQVLVAIGIRTLFDAAAAEVGIPSGLTFAEKLTVAAEGRLISDAEAANLSALTDAGSAAAHRGWIPPRSQIALMLDVVEAFLHRTIILGGAAPKIREGVPPRPPRPAKVPKGPP